MINLYIYILLCISLVQGKLVHSNYAIKTVDIMDVELTTAIFTYEFDTPLYLLETLSCPNTNYTLRQEIDSIHCICDYSYTGCQSLNPCCSPSLCSTGNWTDLTVGDGIYQQLNSSTTAQYRFFTNETGAGYHVYLTRSYGNPSLYIHTDGPPSSDSFLWYQRPNYKISQFLCPTHAYFSLGTFFISVQTNDNEGSEFYITIEKAYVPELVATTQDNYITENDYSYLLVEPNVTTLGYAETAGNTYYVLPFTGCHYVTVTLIGLDPTTDFDLYMSFSNPFPDWLASDHSSFTWGDEYTAFYMCPPPGLVSGNLYITVYSWYDETSYTLDVNYVTASFLKFTALNELNSFESFYYLQETSQLVLNDGTRQYCDSNVYDCFLFWPIKATGDGFPFWPVPNAIKSLAPEYKQIFGDLRLPLSPVANSYQFAVLLNYSIDGISIPLIDFSNLRIQFGGKIFQENLAPVQFLVPMPAEPSDQGNCDYDTFYSKKLLIEQIISQLGDSSEIYSLSFQLDSVKFLNDWYNCQFLLNEIFVFESEMTEIESKRCHKVAGTEEYERDSCCSEMEGWQYACRESTLSVEENYPVSIKKDILNQEFRDPLCMSSYLDDYQSSYQSASCSSPDTSNTQHYLSTVYQSYRSCQTTAFSSVPCTSSSDCIINNSSFSCSPLGHYCIVPYNSQVTHFLTCLVSTLDRSQELFLKAIFNLNVTKEDPKFVSQLYEKLIKNDCIPSFSGGFNFPYSSHYTISPSSDCASATGSCTSTDCVDTACEVQENSCLTWCGGQFQYFPSSQEICENQYFCNYNSTLCEGLTSQECENVCEGGGTMNMFCAICDESENCVDMGLTESMCNVTDFCVLYDGTILVNVSQSECQSYGQCSQPCPMECIGTRSEVCYTSVNQSECVGGSWEYGKCVFSLNQTACENFGGKFERCEDLSLDQCFSCTEGNCDVNQDLLNCNINKSPTCTSEQQCKISGGSCSDRSALSNYGNCIIPQTFPNGSNAGVSVLPFCLPGTTDVPNGCVDPLQDYYNCTGEWWTWATNKSECEKRTGCWEIYPEEIYPTIQFSFSPKSPQDCAVDQGTVKSFFTWEQGEWIPGTFSRAKWISKQSFPRNKWAPSIDFQKLQQSYVQSSILLLALQSKSSALCKYSLNKETITTVACNHGDGDRNCFSNIAVPVAEGRVCDTFNTTIKSSFAVFISSDNSIQLNCANVLLSLVSASVFSSSRQAMLSNLANLKEEEPYAFTNEKDAVIGAVLSDGMQVSAESRLGNVEICIQKRLNLGKESHFDVLDFAWTSETDFSTKTLVPMGVTPYVHENLTGYICTHLNSIEGTPTYFLVSRYENWQDAEPSLFDSATVGMSYTLASMFLLVSMYAAYRLVLLIRYTISIKMKPGIESVMIISLFLFNLIRSIYFWILPTGFQSITADYVLVVLPSFLFLSTFTLVVALWAIVVLKSLTSDIRLLARYANLAVNSFFYLTFLATVLSFRYAVSIPTTSCPGRVTVDLSHVYKTRQIISLVYTSLIALASLVIAAGFLYFGWRLNKLTSRIESRSKYKLQMMTIICSVAFLLHSLFFLVLASLDQASTSIVVIFVGLIVTELAPSIVLLFIFPGKSVGTKSTTKSKSSTSNR